MRRGPGTSGNAYSAAVVGDLRVGTGSVLAARDMAAERRCAAALDRRHHLQLAEADMTAVGLTPSGPVVAENIRDLQGWSSHDRRGYGAGGSALSRFARRWRGARRPPGGSRPRDQSVATRCNALWYRAWNVRATLRSNATSVFATLEQMGGKTVAKRVRRDRFCAAPRLSRPP